MKNEIYANAYQEVIEILKYTKKEDLEKIPKYKINMYKKYMNKENGFKIDKTKSLEEQNISNEARAILANLYKDYWATDVERQKIDAKEQYDLDQIAKEKYNTDNLFKERKIKSESYFDNENSMITAENEKWYKKLFNNIKKFFSKKNNNELSIKEDKKLKKYRFIKRNANDLMWWVDNREQVGEMLFSFDRKKVYNLFKDYPHNLTQEEKEIFDKENPYWREFFKDRK